MLHKKRLNNAHMKNKIFHNFSVQFVTNLLSLKINWIIMKNQKFINKMLNYFKNK